MSGLSDFRQYFQSFIGLITAGVATTALVLVMALFDLAPPWPPAIVQITAIAQLLALVLVFQTANRMAKARITARMRLWLAVLVVALLCYLALHSLLHFTMPDGAGNLRGLTCTPDAQALYPACPFLPVEEIADAEFEADRLWTAPSLALARLAVVSLWIATFCALVLVLAHFVAYQRRV